MFERNKEEKFRHCTTRKTRLFWLSLRDDSDLVKKRTEEKGMKERKERESKERKERKQREKDRERGERKRE